MSSNSNRRSAYLRSLMVALSLAVLTIMEYYAAILLDSWPLLLLMAILKAFIVVIAYMHVSRLWKPEEEH